MPIATTFFEKNIPSEKREAHLDFLANTGFNLVEFLPHTSCMPLKELKALQRKALELNMGVAYHSPDFLDPANYQPGLFRSHASIKKNYGTLLNWIADGVDGTLNFPLVIHSVNSTVSQLQLKEAQDVNLSFFDWIANEVTRQNLPISICLENTYINEEANCIQSLETIHDFFWQMKGAPIFLCLDLPHWWRQCQFEKRAPEDLLKIENELLLSKIIYAHLHGIDEKTDKSHLQLKREHSRFFDFVKAFADKKPQINLNLEIFEFDYKVNFSTYQTLIAEQLQLVNAILNV